MKRVRNLLLWLLLLTKRLYKKPAYIAIMLIIPVVIFAYSLTARQDSGMLTIVLSAQMPEDSLSASIINELIDSSNVIRFIGEKDADAAESMVYNGAADAAWIVSADIEEEMKAFVSGHYTGKGFVRVVIREETVPLLLANEKLSGRLFVHCARKCFVEHLRQEDRLSNDLSDEVLAAYFDGVSFKDDLFSYSYITASQADSNAGNYLLMPVRGILSIIVLIGAMAAAMFYITDDQEGLFSWINLRRKPYVELGCQLITVSNIMAVVVIALFAAKLQVSVFRELLVAILYVVCCAVFGQLTRILCHNRQTIGMLMPLLAMVMLVFCPVFISFPGLKAIQLLFPPTYYLNAVYNTSYMFYMVLYTIVLWGLYKLSTLVLKRI